MGLRVKQMEVERLKPSDNRKTRFFRDHYNAFALAHGLPAHGGTCPGATGGHGGCLAMQDGRKTPTCYAARVRKTYKAYDKVVRDNTRELAGKTYGEMVDLLSAMIGKWYAKQGKKAPCFRIHMEGDFYSTSYTLAWVKVASLFPEVKFWCYTRSLFAVGLLAQRPNITVYISADPVNRTEAEKEFAKYESCPNVGMAYMGDKPPADKRWVVCPAVSGKIKGRENMGACSICRLCIDRRNHKTKNIQFPVHR